MLKIFCDGGSRGNPGHAAWGFVVKDGDSFIKKAHGYIGIATNNEAEYTAVVEALTWLASNYGGKYLNFYLDSNLVVSQLTGKFKIKNQNIKTFVDKIRNLEKNFPTISYEHIPREKNKEADREVNIALDSKLYDIR